MHALGETLRVPDVRSTFDEFGISAGLVRNEMVGNAARVLNAAPQEFARVASWDAAADAHVRCWMLTVIIAG